MAIPAKTASSFLRALRGLALAVPLVLAGCAAAVHEPPVTPLTRATGYGYVETPLGGDRYEVAYRTRWRTSPGYGVYRETREQEMRDYAMDMALWRSALLALERGYASFDVEQRGPIDLTTEIDPYPRVGGSLLFGYGYGRAPFHTGFGFRHPFYWDRHHYTRFPHLGRDRARTRGEARIVVQMYENGRGEYDAMDLARRFGDRYILEQST